MKTTRALRPALTAAVLLTLCALAPAAGAAAPDPGAAASEPGASASEPGAAALETPGSVEVAGRSSDQCQALRFCLWSGTSFSGAFWSTGTGGTQATVIGTARSVWNRMTVDVQTFAGAGASGAVQCWDAGAQSGGVSAPSISIRTMGTTTC
ncbi:peptidase inhibitor family I36 protein [Cellulomonas sp. Marseille-Q8402]